MRYFKNLCLLLLVMSCLLVGLTYKSVEDNFSTLNLDVQSEKPVRILDRYAREIKSSYFQAWSPLKIKATDISPFFLKALLTSEDKNFFEHHGVDFWAKIRAIYINLTSLSISQGGSTITEQVVRILDSRPKSLWVRWTQMWMARMLEQKESKLDILSFYLSQAPYASHRRGISQGAQLYFARDLSTLSPLETLQLIVMLRAPVGYDVRKGSRAKGPVLSLARRLNLDLKWKKASRGAQSPFISESAAFTDHLLSLYQGSQVLHSSLDQRIQMKAQELLDEQLVRLRNRGAHHGAVVVIEIDSGKVRALAQVNNNAGDNLEGGIDVASVPRQPGSTLKPFLYTLAFEEGHSPSEIIFDTDLETSVAGGLHQLSNYSKTHYGALSLRQALANSLNIPAVRVIRKIGVDVFLRKLQSLPLNLTKDAGYYGDGLTLGNPEISLLDMAQAYTCLAGRGICHRLSFLENENTSTHRAFTQVSADLTRDILSDPEARTLEFSPYDFSHQVAVKTGTSTDFRDSWAFMFNARYLVGVWIGNLDTLPMDEVNGSTGAFQVARSLIENTHIASYASKFNLDSKLERRNWCFRASPETACSERTDLFVRDRPVSTYFDPESREEFRIIPETSKLHLAIDPRIPREDQIFNFEAQGHNQSETKWLVDGQVVSVGDKFAWLIKPGHFKISAQLSGLSTEKVVNVYVH